MFACRAQAGCMHQHSFYRFIVVQHLESRHLLASCVGNYAGDALQSYIMSYNIIYALVMCVSCMSLKQPLYPLPCLVSALPLLPLEPHREIVHGRSCFTRSRIQNGWPRFKAMTE